jgi:hypothetical protein
MFRSRTSIFAVLGLAGLMLGQPAIAQKAAYEIDEGPAGAESKFMPVLNFTVNGKKFTPQIPAVTVKKGDSREMIRGRIASALQGVKDIQDNFTFEFYKAVNEKTAGFWAKPNKGVTVDSLDLKGPKEIKGLSWGTGKDYEVDVSYFDLYGGPGTADDILQVKLSRLALPQDEQDIDVFSLPSYEGLTAEQAKAALAATINEHPDYSASLTELDGRQVVAVSGPSLELNMHLFQDTESYLGIPSFGGEVGVVVPEPASLSLLLGGLVGLGGIRRRSLS